MPAAIVKRANVRIDSGQPMHEVWSLDSRRHPPPFLICGLPIATPAIERNLYGWETTQTSGE
jgi:hypothetical protein